MAAGDTHVSAKFVANSTLASLASLWGTNTIKMGITTTVPAVADSDPRWGAGGSQNYATNEIATGGNYAAGGPTLAGTTVTLVSATTQLNATSPLTIAASASNPNPAAQCYGIFYDSTDAGKHVFGYIDLGAALNLIPGITLNFAGVGSGTQIVLKGVAS